MKTRLLIIIVTLVVISGIIQYEKTYGSINKIDTVYDVIQISGLDKTHYLLSEPVVFGISATDLVECGKVVFEIFDKDNMTKIHEGGVKSSCGDPSNWRTSFGVFINSPDARSIVINHAGDFRVIAWVEYQNGTKITTEKEFSLRKNMSDASLDRMIYPVPWEDRPPLKQYKDGLNPSMIHCNDDLALIQKHDGLPACVKPSSMWSLTERGWMTLVTFETFSGFPRHDIENGKITSMKLVKDTSCLPYITITMESKDSGNLKIFVSRNIIDPKINGQDDSFIVLIDGREVAYNEENSSIEYRSLNIQFDKGAKSIEIIATCLI